MGVFGWVAACVLCFGCEVKLWEGERVRMTKCPLVGRSGCSAAFFFSRLPTSSESGHVKTPVYMRSSICRGGCVYMGCSAVTGGRGDRERGKREGKIEKWMQVYKSSDISQGSSCVTPFATTTHRPFDGRASSPGIHGRETGKGEAFQASDRNSLKSSANCEFVPSIDP